MAKKKEAEVPQKVRLRIKSYDHKLIDNSARQIIEAAERHDAKVVGPIPLPTEIKRYTVNRSTFVHKDSREQFELRVVRLDCRWKILDYHPAPFVVYPHVRRLVSLVDWPRLNFDVSRLVVAVVVYSSDVHFLVGGVWKVFEDIGYERLV